VGLLFITAALLLFSLLFKIVVSCDSLFNNSRGISTIPFTTAAAGAAHNNKSLSTFFFWLLLYACLFRRDKTQKREKQVLGSFFFVFFVNRMREGGIWEESESRINDRERGTRATVF
jgi:hypothetical protein